MTENTPNSAWSSARAVSTAVTKFVPLIRTWSASANPFLRRKPKRRAAGAAAAAVLPARGNASDDVVGDGDEGAAVVSKLRATVDIRRDDDNAAISGRGQQMYPTNSRPDSNFGATPGPITTRCATPT